MTIGRLEAEALMPPHGGLVLRASRILTPDVEIRDGMVITSGTSIVAVDAVSKANFPHDAVVFDLGDCILAPGFIDLHVHGNGGAWWGESREKDRAIARRMAAGGTTSCLASLGGRRHLDRVLAAIEMTSAMVGSGVRGVEVLGIHMEGPFINPEKKGAWTPQQLREPDREELRRMQAAAGGRIKTMTIAPELLGALGCVEEAIGLGITPAIGHTNATYEEAMLGVETGINYATHTYNAMRGLHHRDPGALGAVLATRGLDAELIADGQHVDEGAMRVLLAAKGGNHVVLVTDNVALAGLKPGVYGQGRRRVTVTEGGVQLADGTIAGSVIPFNRHVANMARIAGLPAALRMASTNPSRVIGVDNRKGSLEPGKDADLLALDEDCNVRLVVNRGRIIYSAADIDTARLRRK